ncbi:MAG: hypothetical protein LC745_01775, partial [Planctomycetia bacterium]|nr:hypothetical protein [Planctomycetia bacterium]
DPTSGQIKYDVDNDGDGLTDSVWLDLGYAPKRSAENQLYKPLFAFMVIGLNGRLPLNTAGNLQKRNNQLQPAFSHAEHLGNSPSEIDLSYALQNAWDPNFVPTNVAPPMVYFQGNYQQYDNTGFNTLGDSPVNVRLTQLRNILTGTKAPDPSYNPNNPSGSTPSANFDTNSVIVNGLSVLLPNNLPDVADYGYSPTNPVVTRYTAPVAGRWGEPYAIPSQLGGLPLFNNPVRAGFSAVAGSATAYDARDDNFSSFDISANGEADDYYDPSGSLAFPVERNRRFVTPIDLDGNGRVIPYNDFTWDSTNNVLVLRNSASVAGDNGADVWGRVSFFNYFRPPGLPIATTYHPPLVIPTPRQFDNVLGTVIVTPGASGPPDTYQYKGPSNPFTALPNPPLYPTPPFDRSINALHGFESNANPDMEYITGAPFSVGLAVAGRPSDLPNTATSTPPGPLTSGGSALPTYSQYVNSNPGYISPGLNEADEMNLYAPNRLDAPFGPSDLEWLYRYQDIDGGSLQSRLSLLAPISFLNPKDGPRRRRLFSLDSWDTTNFVWANDNPGGAFGSNSRFTPYANASFYTVNYPNPVLLPNSPNPQGFLNPVNSSVALSPDPAIDFSPQGVTGNYRSLVGTPSIAHRDRKVNLNFPLPVSNSPVEPVRQKWIRETYQLLKAVLPPRAVDTPEELAQLSQYVVNIIDFRDPDCTMTRFVNTDVIVNEPSATSLTTQATLGYSTGAPPSVAFDPYYNPGLSITHYLVQHGMEYQPVAINEILAYQYQYNSGSGTNPTGAKPATSPPAPVNQANNATRMFVELVNMLTKDGQTNNNPDSSDLDMAGWDFVVEPDDVLGRPDPITGQVPLTNLTYKAVPLNGDPVYT